MRTRSSKGWGRLPRTIARALAGAKINVSESRVLWAIVYKTIAFNKTEDRIPWSQLSDLTGIDEWHLTKPINSLLKKGIIFRKSLGFGIQEDFSKWETPPKQVVVKDSPPIQEDSPPIQEDSPPIQVDSRDLSKRAFQEKGLSAFLREEKREEYKKGLAMMKEAIEKIPGK